MVVGEEGRTSGECEEQCSAGDVISRTTPGPGVW